MKKSFIKDWAWILIMLGFVTHAHYLLGVAHSDNFILIEQRNDLMEIVEECVDIQTKGWEAFEMARRVCKYDYIMEVLKEVESNYKLGAIGDGGKAYGVLQIHKNCIRDVNKFYGTTYTHNDAFAENCSEEIFYLYQEMGKIRFKKKYDKEPSEEDIVRMWNGGIYAGYKNPKTEKYYKKYKKLMYDED